MKALSSFFFKGWELDLAVRYLKTRRKNGGIAFVAMLSYVGVALAVAAIAAFIYPIQRGLEGLFHFSFVPGGMAYLPATVRVGEVAFVVVTAFIATSICTLIPALSAARLEPIDALRYE